MVRRSFAYLLPYWIADDGQIQVLAQVRKEERVSPGGEAGSAQATPIYTYSLLGGNCGRIRDINRCARRELCEESASFFKVAQNSIFPIVDFDLDYCTSDNHIKNEKIYLFALALENVDQLITTINDYRKNNMMDRSCLEAHFLDVIPWTTLTNPELLPVGWHDYQESVLTNNLKPDWLTEYQEYLQHCFPNGNRAQSTCQLGIWFKTKEIIRKLQSVTNVTQLLSNNYQHRKITQNNFSVDQGICDCVAQDHPSYPPRRPGRDCDSRRPLTIRPTADSSRNWRASPPVATVAQTTTTTAATVIAPTTTTTTTPATTTTTTTTPTMTTTPATMMTAPVTAASQSIGQRQRPSPPCCRYCRTYDRQWNERYENYFASCCKECRDSNGTNHNWGVPHHRC